MSVQSEINRLKEKIADAYAAVRSKGGTVPDSQVIGNLETAINSIPTGATVQRKSGTFTTDSSGNATVTCGFKPDLVVLHHSEGGSSGTSSYSCAAAFAEDTRKSIIKLALLSKTVEYYEITVHRSDTGFYIESVGYLGDWSEVIEEITFSYVAVKYTE